ncbi:MAG: LysR family transcriptional regulator [Clostridia bacterium]
MNQQSWETFRAVAEVGSISGAARVLNLSQSAVSQQIQQLESQYATHLLVRSAHGVRLTPAGEVLYRYAIKILTALDESHERIRGLSEGAPERIRVGASFTIAEYLLPELLTRLYRPRSHGTITVTMANSAAVLDLVVHQAVDVGLVEVDVHSPEMVARRFYHDNPAVFVNAAHPWARRSRVSLEEFLQEPLILREPGSGTRATLEQALSEMGLGVDDLTVSLVLGTTQAIKAMVRAGFGASVLSPLTVLPEERPDFASVQVDGLYLFRSFHAVHLPLPLSDGVRRFVRLLAREATAAL